MVWKTFRFSLFLILLLVPASIYFLNAQGVDTFGALAYCTTNGSYGFSYNFPSRSEAEARARQECLNYSGGANCIVLVWFQNGCGALATGPNGYGSGWGSNQGIAENYAIQSCSQHSANCQVAVTVCSSVGRVR